MSIQRLLVAVLGVGGTVRVDQDTADGSVALHHVPEVNGVAVSTGNPLPVTDAALGTDATGITQLAGGAGARGWLSALFAGIGTTADAAWVSGAGTVIALLKNAATGVATIGTNTGNTVAGLGTSADALWSGAGSGTLIATLKALTGSRTPAAGTNSIVATGGTAVIAITGPVRGGYITNPENALDQGFAANATPEQLFVDPVTAPGSTAGSGNGTCSSLDPGQSWPLPCAIPAGVTVRVNAATSGHKFTVVTWN